MECPNSWSRTLRKNTTAVATPTSQYSAVGQFLNSDGKYPEASVQATRAKIRNQE
jgi:hypothetical protein